jgi:uncharacterized protein with NRDE domain
MVTAWLGAGQAESTESFLRQMLEGGGVKGVGGFSLICGKLRQRKRRDGEAVDNLEPLAIMSNRNDVVGDVPWICEERGEVYGLSNTDYGSTDKWPKVENGKRLLKEAVKSAVDKNLDEEGLLETLFGVLDTNTLPQHPGMSFEQQLGYLKESIFIPAIGDEEHRQAMLHAMENGRLDKATAELQSEVRPDESPSSFETGMYGTQRQTVILIDWDGNLTFRERALWDANGNKIKRGEGDVTFNFKVEGWDDSLKETS